MTTIPEAAHPPAPPGPKKVAKGLGGALKGKPAWVYIAGVTVLVGVAYLFFRRGSGGATDPTVQQDSGTADYGPDPYAPGFGVGGAAGGGYVGADPGLGSFGGGDVPFPDSGFQTLPDAQGVDSTLPWWADPAYAGNWIPASLLPLIIKGQDSPTQATPTPTGGGLPKSKPAAHAITPQAARAEAMKNRKLPLKKLPPGVLTTKPKSGAVAPAGFAHAGPHGWYRQEKDKKGQFHLYQSGKKVYVK